MLLVNEIFGPTIQGEGKSAGEEVLFLRLAGCNLACIWCDTPYTWNWIGTKFVHPEKYDKRKEVHKMEVAEVVDKLKNLSSTIKRLVITGGEPLLQQRQLLELLRFLRQDGWWIEVETNGTIVPTDGFLSLVEQINCSPKLGNSGVDNTLQKRERPEALIVLASSPKTTFKFVVSSDADILEILLLVMRFQMKQVYLMPEGRTKVEQLDREDKVRELCAGSEFNFSPRLQVLAWDTKRGV